ncbi:MAG: acetolactate synthase small subunit [bacterium]|jgi:acetolactate synthase small subunit
MIQIDLSTEETDVMKQVLEEYISDLRMEIADTDTSTFKRQLKKKKEVVLKILDLLVEVPA